MDKKYHLKIQIFNIILLFLFPFKSFIQFRTNALQKLLQMLTLISQELQLMRPLLFINLIPFLNPLLNSILLIF